MIWFIVKEAIENFVEMETLPQACTYIGSPIFKNKETRLKIAPLN